MAIVRVIEPNVPPTETADWGRMLELIRSLELRAGDSNIVDWPSLTIKKSAVFFLGGTVYQADADTAISGTTSSFVKLTPSSDGSVCTASYATSLTGVSWNSTYNGWYDTSGNLYVFQAALPDRPHMARFESSGTFVVPLGIDTIYISGCAAGGKGGQGLTGGGSAAGNNDSGGGGGGGGGGQQIIREPFSVNPGTAISVTIGAVGSDTIVGSLLTLKHGNNGANCTHYAQTALGGARVESYGSPILYGAAGGNGGTGVINGEHRAVGADGADGYSAETNRRGGGGGAHGPSLGYVSGGGGGGGGGGYSGYGLNGTSLTSPGGYGYSGGGGGAGGAFNESGGNGGNGGYGAGGGGGGGYGSTVESSQPAPYTGLGGAGGPALIIIEW